MPPTPTTRPLRIFLPPNLAACAPRDSIPLKIEGSPSNLPEILLAACTGPGPGCCP